MFQHQPMLWRKVGNYSHYHNSRRSDQDALHDHRTLPRRERMPGSRLRLRRSICRYRRRLPSFVVTVKLLLQPLEVTDRIPNVFVVLFYNQWLHYFGTNGIGTKRYDGDEMPMRRDDGANM